MTSMKTISAMIFAIALIAGTTSCSDDAIKFSDCTRAARVNIAASKAFAAKPNKGNCIARNASILEYRRACERMPEGLDTLACEVYDIFEDLNK